MKKQDNSFFNSLGKNEEKINSHFVVNREWVIFSLKAQLTELNYCDYYDCLSLFSEKHLSTFEPTLRLNKSRK